VLADISQNLVAIIGQRLIPGIEQKRVAAIELMLGTPYIKDLIQRDQLDELKSAIARSQEQGLQTFDQELFRLFSAKSISLEEALKFADSKTDLTLKIKLERGFSDETSDTLEMT
jgi:twitching motility protein PilU